jgi:hypothetical protein
MTWKPTDDMDREVRGWMKAKGWEVNCRPEYGGKVYGWRHEVRGAPSPTLRIAREVLENYPPFAVAELLDRLNVAASIRARPDARYAVVQKGSKVTLEEPSRERKRSSTNQRKHG